MSAFPLPADERCAHAPLRDIAERGSLSRAECSDCDTLIDLSSMPLHSDADLAAANEQGYREGRGDTEAEVEAARAVCDEEMTDDDHLDRWWIRWGAKADDADDEAVLNWMDEMAKDAPWM